MSDVEKNPFPKLVSWEVWNFMSIEHALCEFDERNIINLKGYNDSGKSAMLSALKVLLTNSNPNKQTDFIQDDKEYFRVLATFEDKVQILRDKYINGQSLYEMYKNGELIYSTKSGNSLSRVSEVPQPIADYLGLISYEKTFLNARSCFEKQIGVQTTGSENYKMFNTVLKSEEISTASTLLNNDKNKLASDINAIDAEINANKTLIGQGQFLSAELIDYLKEHDGLIDDCESRENVFNQINSFSTSIDNVVITPELSVIDTDDLQQLYAINALKESLRGIVITPEVSVVDAGQLSAIQTIKSLLDSCDLNIAPEVSIVDEEQLKILSAIQNIVSSLFECDAIINEDDARLSELNSQLEALEKEAATLGAKMIKCPHCGNLFDPETAGHQH